MPGVIPGPCPPAPSWHPFFSAAPLAMPASSGLSLASPTPRLQAPTVPGAPSVPLIFPWQPLSPAWHHIFQPAACQARASPALHARALGLGLGLPKSSSLNTILAHPSLGAGDAQTPASQHGRPRAWGPAQPPATLLQGPLSPPRVSKRIRRGRDFVYSVLWAGDSFLCHQHQQWPLHAGSPQEPRKDQG